MFWIIYILGIVATLWIYFHNLENDYEVSLLELFFVISGVLFSWFTFIIAILVIYGDKTVFKKK
jgi:hypothetical protein